MLGDINDEQAPCREEPRAGNLGDGVMEQMVTSASGNFITTFPREVMEV